MEGANVERLRLIFDQLEESKRLIHDGGVPQLRMALLLLDNAAEILMYRTAENEFLVSGWYERMWQRLTELPVPPPDEDWVKDIRARIIPDSLKRKIRKFFDEKVRYLTEDRNLLQPAVAQVLSSIHRYRNEAYHRDKVRKEIIRPVVLLLYEVVCDLLPRLRPHGVSFLGGEDYSWLEERYGVKYFEAADESGLSAIGSSLRRELPLSLEELREALISHLNERLDDVMQALQFIGEDGLSGATAEEVLKTVQFWSSGTETRQFPNTDEYRNFDPPYTLKTIERWRERIQAMHRIQDKMDLFVEFASRENTLEPIELLVHERAAELDAYIQLQIDIMRGK